jgi:hypothetical protein
MPGPNSDNQTSALLSLGDVIYQHRKADNETDKALPELETLSKQRIERDSLLAQYSSQLNTLNPLIFHYLTPAQKAQWHKQLLLTFYLFSAQAKIDEAEARTRNLPDLMAGMNKCLKRLEELCPLLDENRSPEEKQLKAASTGDEYLKYLGLTIVAPWLTSKIMELVNSASDSELNEKPSSQFAYKASLKPGRLEGKKSSLLIEWMSQVNGRRLYWVWGGGMLASILELLDFTETLPDSTIGHAQKGLGIPAPITGNMSWALYYTRLGINLFLLLKHTIKGPWMSKEESDIAPWERFKTQWNQRKFSILNDSIWATANMVCFFWLRGGGMLGYAGNVLTAMLLLMDLCISIWAFLEESTRHNVEKAAFTERQTDLRLKIAGLSGQLTEKEKQRLKLPEGSDEKQQCEEELAALKLEQEQLQAELVQLDKLIEQSDLAWTYKKYSLTSSIAYSASLLFGFCMVCCFFFPPAVLAPIALVVMGVAGASLCFTLTILAAALSGGLDIAKSKDSLKEARKECSELLKKYLAITPDGNQDSEKKLLFIEIKALRAESVYQEEMIRFQAIKLARGIFVNACTPALVFASLVLMPTGIGVGVLAAGFVLAVATHLFINRFEPQREKIKDLAPSVLSEFEKEFAEFATAVTSLNESDSPEKKLALLFEKEEQASRGCFFAGKKERGKVSKERGKVPSVQIPLLSFTATQK